MKEIEERVKIRVQVKEDVNVVGEYTKVPIWSSASSLYSVIVEVNVVVVIYVHRCSSGLF